MKKLLKFYAVAFVLLSDFAVFAQPGDEDTGGGLEGNDPQPAPINGKLIYLALLGTLFVLYIYKKNRKTV